jgi:hypothetical protein
MKKQKLKLHRDTIRQLQSGEVTGGQLGIPTLYYESCVVRCPVYTAAVSCGGTCQASCFTLC